MNKFYIIFYFILNSLAWGQTQVIPSLEASASNLSTAGGVPYISSPGVLNLDASNFFWDATNHRLGIGTNAPASIFHVSGTSPEVRLTGSGTGSGDLFTINLLNSTYSAQITHGGTAYSGLGGANSLNLYTLVAGAMTFGTASSERGRITATGSWGIGTSNTAPTGTLHVYDATASTGVTTLTVKAGAGQSTTNLQEWQNNAGTVLAAISSAGLYRQPLTTPASAAATCTAGTIVADTGFVYVCTATDTWKRVAIASW